MTTGVVDLQAKVKVRIKEVTSMKMASMHRAVTAR